MGKNKEFINEYDYTEEVVKEASSCWWKYKSKKATIAFIIGIIISILQYLKEFNYIFLIFIFFFIFLLFLMEKRKRQSIKIELERINVLFKDRVISIKIVVKENIKMYSEGNERSINFSDIESYKETTNLIVLMVKGSMALAIKKDGFKKGDFTDFLEFLKDNIKIKV